MILTMDKILIRIYFLVFFTSELYTRMIVFPFFDYESNVSAAEIKKEKKNSLKKKHVESEYLHI